MACPTFTFLVLMHCYAFAASSKYGDSREKDAGLNC